MLKQMRRIPALVVVSLLGGCGGGTDEPVVDTTVASVNVSSSSNTVAPGSTLQMTATAKNASNVTLPGMSASWSSSNENAATVNSSGLVTGVAAGTTTITATISGIEGKTDITVQAISASPTATVQAGTNLAFDPTRVDISAGGSVTWQFTAAVAHNVTFTPGATGTPENIGDSPGQNVSRTFTTAGTFQYQCTNHAGMTGTVVVH